MCSFWLDSGGLHNGPPALDVGLDLRGERFGGVSDRLDAVSGVPPGGK
jgi:hypothetical protein